MQCSEVCNDFLSCRKIICLLPSPFHHTFEVFKLGISHVFEEFKSPFHHTFEVFKLGISHVFEEFKRSVSLLFKASGRRNAMPAKDRQETFRSILKDNAP